MRKALLCVFLIGCFTSFSSARASACTATGFVRDGINMTAAIMNPTGTVSGTVDATGCNIGVYSDTRSPGVSIKDADIFGANYFGVLVNADAGSMSVDITDSHIHDIGEVPHNGSQHGVAIYIRGFFLVSAVNGKISGNTIWGYQKGGIVVNGMGAQYTVTDNMVTGDGHVTYIAQNGIQIGYGAQASVMRNDVSGNSYDGHGDGSASGGILVVGGPGYGICPDGSACPYTVNTKIMDNTLTNNDVGVYLSNLAADFSAPDSATNAKAVNNTISNDLCFNFSYQAAISDVGNNDKMINNRISGPACTSAFNPAGFEIDASTDFTNRPKVQANK